MFRGRCIGNDFPIKAIHQAEIIKKSVFLFWLFIMAIRCEQVHRLELRKFFLFLGCCGKVASVPKVPSISYSPISYFGHARPKLICVLISCLTGKFATRNLPHF